jgi:hypothetical protein
LKNYDFAQYVDVGLKNQEHLIGKHNVSEDMLQFWIEKGRWI